MCVPTNPLSRCANCICCYNFGIMFCEYVGFSIWSILPDDAYQRKGKRFPGTPSETNGNRPAEPDHNYRQLEVPCRLSMNESLAPMALNDMQNGFIIIMLSNLNMQVSGFIMKWLPRIPSFSTKHTHMKTVWPLPLQNITLVIHNDKNLLCKIMWTHMNLRTCWNSKFIFTICTEHMTEGRTNHVTLFMWNPN